MGLFLYIYPMNNFERHQDPLTSMNIGITTWDKLQQGQVLKTKKSVRLTEVPSSRGFKIKSDRSPLDNTVLKNLFCHLVRVNHLKVKDGKTKILQITFAEYLSLDNIIDPKDRNFRQAKTITGTIDQFNSRFEIIQ